MKITKVEPLLLDRFLYVRISTDAGITGIGESGHLGPARGLRCLDHEVRRLPGRQGPVPDRAPLERHAARQSLHRRRDHRRGFGDRHRAVGHQGQAFGVPVYELLGGKMRHKARLYGHVKGRTIETLVEEAVRLKEAGFTALGHLNPLLDESEDEPYYKPHAAQIEEAIDNVRRLREAVGPKVDLCIEIHRRLTPPEAIALGRGIEKYTPMFFEDPLRPNSFDAMAEVARHIDIPIATGERFTQPLPVPDAADAQRGAVSAAGRVPGGRHHRGEEGRRDRRGARCVGGAAQPAVADQHRGVPADRRLHPELRHPGVSVADAGPGRRQGAAGQRPGDRAGGAGGRLHRDPQRRRGSGWNWWRTWRSSSRTGHGRSRCAPTWMGRWWTCSHAFSPTRHAPPQRTAPAAPPCGLGSDAGWASPAGSRHAACGSPSSPSSAISVLRRGMTSPPR